MNIRTKTLSRALRTGLAAAALMGTSVLAVAEGYASAVTGLWKYTSLTTSGGQSMPLTGIFLLHDGKFLQQSIFDGEPFSNQGAMAHSGRFVGTEEGVHLEADQTLSSDPAGTTPLTDFGPTGHDLAVTRNGDKMKFVFGSGTVQTFDLIGDAGNAEIYPLSNGLLAFSDGYFVLVSGDSESAVTGYGTYQKKGEKLQLDVIRWMEAAGGLVQNLRDVTLAASFDGSTLSLADGRQFVAE